MGSMQFMNQDGEWETWPLVSEIPGESVSDIPVEAWITCQLCNEPVLAKDIKVSFDTEHQWACIKCSAVNG